MLLQQLINGLTIGSTYALVTIGFSLIFSVLKLMNFANGSVFVLGAYFTLGLWTWMGGNVWAALIGSIILTGIVGYSIDRFVLRTLRTKNAPGLAPMITTMGVSTVIENAILIWFGSESKAVTFAPNLGHIEVAGVRISGLQTMILVIAMVLMGIVSWVIYRTKTGKAMLAVSQNIQAAKLMGIDVNAVISATFFVAAVLSSISGTVVGTYYRSIEVSMSSAWGNKVFAAAILGGVGNIPGAILGGLLVGIIETLGASYISAGYRDAIAFLIMIVVLLVKPTGLFGKPNVMKV